VPHRVRSLPDDAVVFGPGAGRSLFYHTSQTDLSMPVFACPLVLHIALTAIGVAPVQLAGTWVLDRGHSTTTGGTLPLEATYKIVQRGDTLFIARHVSALQGTLDYQIIVRLDGSPMHNTMAALAASPGGGAAERIEMPTTVTAKWAHDTLVTTTTGELHGATVSQTALWWLSADSATLTERREVVVNGENTGVQVQVFRRQ
jgi:hypothetical protein